MFWLARDGRLGEFGTRGGFFGGGVEFRDAALATYLGLGKGERNVGGGGIEEF